MKTYKKGDDFKLKTDTHKTFGITEIDPKSMFANKEWTNKIEVYGDGWLRNRIIKLLNNSKKEEPEIDWSNLRCQEASIFSIHTKIDCAQLAEVIVWHNKDRRAYAMCFGCADHNIRNRGGIELARKEAK